MVKKAGLSATAGCIAVIMMVMRGEGRNERERKKKKGNDGDGEDNGGVSDVEYAQVGDYSPAGNNWLKC